MRYESVLSTNHRHTLKNMVLPNKLKIEDVTELAREEERISKKKAQELFADFGMDLSTAVNVFLPRVIVFLPRVNPKMYPVKWTRLIV